MKPKDQDAFFRWLMPRGTRINYWVLNKNKLDVAATKTKHLVREVRKLPPGWYIVHTGDVIDEHYFAVHAHGADEMPTEINYFDEAVNPPGIEEDLDQLTWFRFARSICRVEFMPEDWVWKPKKRKQMM